MPDIYLHPANRRAGAPAGAILVSISPEDDGDGAILVAVDPGNSRVPEEEADSLAAEICRRFNAGNRAPGQQATGPASISYAPLRRTGPDADAPDFSMQVAWIDSQPDRLAWMSATAAAFQEKGAVETRASIDDNRKPALLLMEGWLSRPKAPPPPRFLAVQPPAEG